MTDTGLASAWQLAQDSQLRWAGWDDEFIVFNIGSGETHLLDVFAAEILDRLSSAPARIDELTRLLVDLAGDLDARHAAQHVISILGELSELGLAERVS